MNIKVNENKKETSHSPKGAGSSPGGSNLWDLSMNSQVPLPHLEIPTQKCGQALSLYLSLERAQKAVSTFRKNQ